MPERSRQDYKAAIKASGKDIFSSISVEDNLWIPTPCLETLLNEFLTGLDVNGLPSRTRSKVVKGWICEALGYPIPKRFKKVQPRFFHQQLDIYIQKSRNLQVWNEELSPIRRYAIIQVSSEDKILSVKVVSGLELALLDKTGAITTKYQAQLKVGNASRELISATDTQILKPYTNSGFTIAPSTSPTDQPESGALFGIAEIYKRLSTLIGESFPDPGKDQERNRGAALHKLICERLGYSRYEDNGQFPDIRHQLLEVKLQTSPTIDLGLVLPDSTGPLDGQITGTMQPRHCDTI